LEAIADGEQPDMVSSRFPLAVGFAGP
jgi:hypothetical protein